MPKYDDLADVYRDSVLCQDACNLSGVAHSLARMVHRLHDEARSQGLGTEYVNTHPCVILVLNKLCHLARMKQDNEAFSRAYSKVQGFLKDNKIEL